jgi:hypothetical protein
LFFSLLLGELIFWYRVNSTSNLNIFWHPHWSRSSLGLALCSPVFMHTTLHNATQICSVLNKIFSSHPPTCCDTLLPGGFTPFTGSF